MEISPIYRWFYNLLLGAAMLSLAVTLGITGPQVQNAVLERRLETADASEGLTYAIKMKGLTLYGTRSEWMMDRFNRTAFFSLFGIVLLGMLTGQIKFRETPKTD